VTVTVEVACVATAIFLPTFTLATRSCRSAEQVIFAL